MERITDVAVHVHVHLHLHVHHLLHLQVNGIGIVSLFSAEISVISIFQVATDDWH